MHRYKGIYYDEIFAAVYKKFGINIKLQPRIEWVKWQVQVKRMFDKGILIKEIIDALDEAIDKKKWPIGTGLWKRVEDIVLLHRKELKKFVREDSTMQSIKDIFKK